MGLPQPQEGSCVAANQVCKTSADQYPGSSPLHFFLYPKAQVNALQESSHSTRRDPYATITWTVDDGNGRQAEAKLLIQVTAVNYPPVPHNMTVTDAYMGVPKLVRVMGEDVSSDNPSDPIGSCRVLVVSTPIRGSLRALNKDGTPGAFLIAGAIRFLDGKVYSSSYRACAQLRPVCEKGMNSHESIHACPRYLGRPDLHGHTMRHP